MKRRRLARLRRALLPIVTIAAVASAGALLWINRHDNPASSHPVAAARHGGHGKSARSRPDAKVPPPGIGLISGHAMRIRFKDPPRAGVAFDLGTGEVFWRRHPQRPLPIASLTKIMTALIVVERTDPLEHMRIPKAAQHVSGSSVGNLRRGKNVRVEALLHALLLPSGNDAAVALATHVAGSERKFVRLMNRRAGQLGLRCTHFSSSYGLQAGNRSCPTDLAALSRATMRQPRIARIVRRNQAAVHFPIKGGRLFLNNTNPLLRAHFRGTIGLKTGFTNHAGRCYVGVVRRAGHTYAVVLLHSPNPAKQASRLIMAMVRREVLGG